MPNDSDWPPELEALAAAPAHHIVLLENDSVRVLDTRLAPGETTPVHYHRWPPVATFWSTPLPPQSLENVGDTELRAIAVEVKSPTEA